MESSFSFYIYFVPILNFFYSSELRFPMTILYTSLLRALEETDADCTLGDSSSTKVQYSCEVDAETSNIKQIQI